MLQGVADILLSLRSPHIREVYFRSLSLNRRLLLWYADRLVSKDSKVEPSERLREIDERRRKGESFTFICNHLSYADSHILETLMIRSGAIGTANRLIHIAGQKTFQLWRRPMTRSLNTVRVYQPKAKIDKTISRKMNARALKWSAHMKRRGYSLLVFPEGTRSRENRRFNMTSANPKVTIYFRNSNIVPLALMGSEKILPIHRMIPRSSPVYLKVGEPVPYASVENELRAINPDKTEREIRQVLMLRLMSKINDLLDPEYQYQVPGK